MLDDPAWDLDAFPGPHRPAIRNRSAGPSALCRRSLASPHSRSAARPASRSAHVAAASRRSSPVATGRAAARSRPSGQARRGDSRKLRARTNHAGRLRCSEVPRGHSSASSTRDQRQRLAAAERSSKESVVLRGACMTASAAAAISASAGFTGLSTIGLHAPCTRFPTRAATCRRTGRQRRFEVRTIGA